MAKAAPLYDLVMMLATSAEDEQRAKILSDVESAISGAGGTIERNDDWGRRPMAYEIRHQPEAEYHLLQFKAPPTLIEELSHTLHITDGVVRFRVIKVRPGTPDAPSSPPPVVVAAVSSSTQASAGPSSGAAPERPSEPAAESPAEPAAESAPEPAVEPAESEESEAVPAAAAVETSGGEASADS